jgi:hypothetical protein
MSSFLQFVAQQIIRASPGLAATLFAFCNDALQSNRSARRDQTGRARSRCIAAL